MAKISEAQKKASRKWDKENMIVSSYKIYKEEKEKFDNYAKKAGKTLVEFYREAMEEKAEKEGLLWELENRYKFQ